MKITDLDWHTNDEGATWTLHGNVQDLYSPLLSRRKLFDVVYLGRTRVAFGGGHMRWQVYDRRYWVDDYLEQIPEFKHIHEAKAWVDAVVRLS
jgi:hypothetical protein